jgi:hypothetical protein
MIDLRRTNSSFCLDISCSFGCCLSIEWILCSITWRNNRTISSSSSLVSTAAIDIRIIIIVTHVDFLLVIVVDDIELSSSSPWKFDRHIDLSFQFLNPSLSIKLLTIDHWLICQMNLFKVNVHCNQNLDLKYVRIDANVTIRWTFVSFEIIDRIENIDDINIDCSSSECRSISNINRWTTTKTYVALPCLHIQCWSQCNSTMNT